MKKKLLQLMVLGLMAVVITGCGAKEDSGRCQEALEAALSVTGTDVLDTAVYYGDEVYENNFEKLYNFPMDQIDGGALAYSASGSAADEISIVRASDSKYVSDIKKYMEARLEKRLHDFENYKPEEAGKLENGKVMVSERYVMLIVSDRAEDIANEMKKVLK